MVVLMMHRVPRGLRGLLSRWFLEVQENVFVGDCSATVRWHLWNRACGGGRGTSAVSLAYSDDTEQGYSIMQFGMPTRSILDFDGLRLLKIRGEAPERS
jgi:CRISPR-associated protein Cas2